MRVPAAILTMLVSVSAVALDTPPAPIFVNTRAVVLSFDAAAAESVNHVDVWLRKAASGPWTKTASTRVSERAVRFRTESDGRYECYLELQNDAGRSGPEPNEQSDPHVIVIVDTAAPTLQIHRAYAIASDNQTPRVRLDVSLLEENLGECGLRLFYRPAAGGEQWRDGGSVTYSGGMVEWRPPTDVPDVCDIRLVATDLAGNRALEEVAGVRTASPHVAPASAPTTIQPASPTLDPATGENDALARTEVSGVVVPPLPPVTLDEDTLPALPKANPRAELLRRQAQRFISEGRFALAGARLRDALELTPHDPDVNADLGRVLFETKQYAQAGHRYQLALNADADHEAALEGLSLVEFSQHRYADAREHLRRLLALRPNSGEHWLHYGDIEYRLGDKKQANAAWEKAMGLGGADQDLRKRAERRMKLLARPRNTAK